MRGLTRIIPGGLRVISLFLCIAPTAAWVRSYFRRDVNRKGAKGAKRKAESLWRAVEWKHEPQGLATEFDFSNSRDDLCHSLLCEDVALGSFSIAGRQHLAHPIRLRVFLAADRGRCFSPVLARAPAIHRIGSARKRAMSN